MDPLAAAFGSLIFIIALLALALAFYRTRALTFKAQLTAAVKSRQSLATKHGLTMEQFAPFLDGYPYDAREFRFIGNPIDGLQFCEDRIVFVEFKTGNARLSDDQKRIKELVLAKRVEWLEHKMR